MATATTDLSALTIRFDALSDADERAHELSI